MGQIYENRLNLKKNNEYLDNISQINMAKVEIMLRDQ